MKDQVSWCGGTVLLERNFSKSSAEYQPAKIIVFSRDELKQHECGQRFHAPTCAISLEMYASGPLRRASME